MEMRTKTSLCRYHCSIIGSGEQDLKPQASKPFHAPKFELLAGIDRFASRRSLNHGRWWEIYYSADPSFLQRFGNVLPTRERIDHHDGRVRVGARYLGNVLQAAQQTVIPIDNRQVAITSMEPFGRLRKDGA